MNINWTDLGTILQAQGLKLLSGLVVLVIGFIIVHWIQKLSGRYLKKIKVEPTIGSFLNNVIRLVLYLIVILTAAWFSSCGSGAAVRTTGIYAMPCWKRENAPWTKPASRYPIRSWMFIL